MSGPPRIIPKDLPGQETPVLSERPPRILGTIARHPHLLDPMLKFSAALARGVLSRRDSEILALRASWNCQSTFEWGMHVGYGHAAGLTEAEVERLAGLPPEAGWTDSDAALIRAADELHAEQMITDATWAVLAEHYDEGQLVEIPFVVGQYTMLSMVAKATGVPVYPELPKWPDGSDASAG